MKSTVPRVPHLPGSRFGNDDLVVEPEELPLFVEREVVIVEKLDGVAMTIAFDPFGQLDIGLKSDWKGALEGRILRAARRWLRIHEDLLAPFCADGAQLYSEWLLHRLVTPYDRLPSAVVFHGRRMREGHLGRRDEVNAELSAIGLSVMEPIFRGVIGATPFESFVPKKSAFGKKKAEGIIVEAFDGVGSRWAKWVAPHYRQPKGQDLRGVENVVISSA